MKSSTSQTGVLSKGMHTARSLAMSFAAWFQSIEGGNYVPDFLDDHKQAQRKSQNKKYEHMVQTVLETCLGKEEFHSSSLHLLQTIGKPIGGISVVEKLHEDRSWGTVKTYLNAFSHFIDYTESSCPPLLDQPTAAVIRINLKGSIHTVTKMTLEELQKRKLSDRERVIDFQNVSEYRKMKIAQILSKSLNVDDADSEKDIKEQIHRIGNHVLLV